MTAISVKSKTENEYLENCLNDIMNRPENSAVTLTKELSKKLSTIIKEIYRKIKKQSKYKTYNELIEETKNSNFETDDVLKKYNNQKNVVEFNSEKHLRNL